MKHLARLAVLLCYVAIFAVQQTPLASALSDEDINNLLKGNYYYNHARCQPGEGRSNDGENIELTFEDDAKNVFLFFTSKGYSEEQAAGIIGNMAVESGVQPQRLQNTPSGTVTRAEEVGSRNIGWGIVQWTPASKMIGPVKDSGKDPNDLLVQLEFLFDQLEGKGPIPEKQAGKELKRTRTVEDAVLAFQGTDDGRYYGFERPDDKVGSVPERTAAARAAFDKFSGLSGQPASAGSEDVGSNCSCGVDTSGNEAVETNLNDLVKRLAQENGGQTKISLQTMRGRVKANAGGNDQMPTRSSYKLYTAFATLHAIEAGKISWGTKVWGGKSVEDTMEAMIVESNNDAAEALRTNNKIGKHGEVTTLLQSEVGLSNQTIMGSGRASDPSGSNSKSTANDFVKFLVKLHKKQLPGVEKDESYEKLIGFMKRATTDGGSKREGIAAGVGSGTEVADKPGWASGDTDPASNDVGIVYLQDKEYAIAILTDKPYKWDGVEKIAKEINDALKNETETTVAEGGGCPGEENNQTPGDLAATVKRYAHAEYHSPPFLERKPAYATAVRKAQSQGRYVGGTVRGVPGIDCGGFVSLLVQDSGYDKDYNYAGKISAGAGPTGTQDRWLAENWEKINPNSTNDLKPGDVAVNSVHTYIYVGEIEGFNSRIASASYTTYENGGRAPMAGKEMPADKNFNWYRKK